MQRGWRNPSGLSRGQPCVALGRLVGVYYGLLDDNDAGADDDAVRPALHLWPNTGGCVSYQPVHSLSGVRTDGDPERVRNVQSQLRSEQRALDREIRSLDQGSSKTKAEAKRLAKKGDVKNARMLAKEIALARHRRERLVVGKARMNSIQLQLQQQLAMFKVTGAMQKSTEVMKLSNQLIRLPQLQQSMRLMSQEMMKVRIFSTS